MCVPLQWPYGDICGIGPVGKGQGTEFNLTFRKGSGKKSETLKFSTEHRMELLTEALVRPAAQRPAGTPSARPERREVLTHIRSPAGTPGGPHTHQVPEQQR